MLFYHSFLLLLSSSIFSLFPFSITFAVYLSYTTIIDEHIRLWHPQKNSILNLNNCEFGCIWAVSSLRPIISYPRKTTWSFIRLSVIVNYIAILKHPRHLNSQLETDRQTRVCFFNEALWVAVNYHYSKTSMISFKEIT